MNAPVVGNGMTLGLTNGKNVNSGIYFNNNSRAIFPSSQSYGMSLPNTNGADTPYSNTTVLGVTTDPTELGLITKFSGLTLGTVPSEKLGNFYIRY